MSETEKIIDEVLGQLYPNKELPPKSHAKKVLKPIAQDASMYRYFKRVAKEEFGQSLGAIFVLAGEHTLRAAHASEQGAEQLAKEWSNLASKLDADNGRINGCSWKQADTLRECAAQLAALSQRPTPATENTERVLKALARQPEPWERDLAATPATASEPEIVRAFDDQGRPIGHTVRKPDSASVGKDYSHCVKHNTYPADNDPCWQCIVENIPAATPSGGDYLKSACDHYPNLKHAMSPSDGGEWTVLGHCVKDEHGETLCCAQTRTGAEQTVERHNQSLQPRDCGEDTKRLDWLDTHLVLRKFFKDEPIANLREAIDAAMKEQT